jgi:hypothetical protein
VREANENLIAHTMYTIKTNNQNLLNGKPHFFILSKGMNSGKPLTIPCPNCFIFITESDQEKDFYFWLTFGLWKSKSFHQYLRGSVIPFIVLRDLNNCILSGELSAKSDLVSFYKAVETLKFLDLKEKQFLKNLQLIKEARMVLFYRYNRK